MELTIAEIERVCGGRLVIRRATVQEMVSSVVLDSRQVIEGSVFIAVGGARVDGHQFIGQAYEQGACLVVTKKSPEQVEAEHGVRIHQWGSYLEVEDPLEALRDLAEYYRGKLEIPIVGVTGSVGKTSTKEFIAGVLAEEYEVLKTEGNYNNEIGVPLTLLRIRSKHTAAVVEMGISDFGEMHRLSRMVRPDICVITNIGQCHLENLKDRDGVLQAKSEIFDYMAFNAKVCLNGEDDKLSAVTEVRGESTHFYGLGDNAAEEVYITDVESKGLKGSSGKLHFCSGGSDQTFPVHVPVPGRHMVINAAAAACVAVQLGLTPRQICDGIGKVETVNGRNHLIWLRRYTLIDDCYNANPASMRAALDLLDMADTVKVAILGDMFELGADSDDMHAQIGEYAAQKGIDHILCVGENARYMYEAAKKKVSGGQTVQYFADRQELLRSLKKEPEKLAPKGSCVLVKASHGMVFSEVLEQLQKLGEQN
ncbi:MAG: UDP-N-acetylmuramoyl-tripeptide--D-alanyl-D-alanine ligase [Candidatus Gastranaerophilales bacterium]|nr:UDP-N-acetylmuramoyl-tripeptide--D-alanyl-D-alanine ligase [Candidatus Gastranaerophilales bacterium]